MELTVKDGNIVRDRITPLREYLHMVFFDRCGFEIDFDVIYKEAKHEAKETPVVHMQLAVVTEDGVTEGSQTASSDSAAGANDKKADEAQGTGVLPEGLRRMPRYSTRIRRVLRQRMITRAATVL